MKTRHFITVADLTPEGTLALFDEAEALKQRLSRGVHERCLADKSLVMIFEKASSRTRLSFEIGMTQLGGHAVYVGMLDERLGERESVPDAARVVSGYADGVMLRTYAHGTVMEFAKPSSVPVINGRSDYNHPCQALTDLFTIREKLGNLKKIKLAYVGAGNNVARSLAWACYRRGMRFAIASPKGYELGDRLIKKVRNLTPESGGTISKLRDPHKAVRGADVVYTDVWASMGQEDEAAERRKIFRDYQVNARLLDAAGKGALVMHCLPAHRGDEITGDVIDGKQSIVFDQAENRMHLQKGILKMLLG